VHRLPIWQFIEDTPSFRTLVMWSFILGYGFSFLSFGALPLLPAQKAQAQTWKRSWSSSRRIGYLTAGVLIASFTYAVALLLLTMFPATACLPIVGGDGC